MEIPRRGACYCQRKRTGNFYTGGGKEKITKLPAAAPQPVLFPVDDPGNASEPVFFSRKYRKFLNFRAFIAEPMKYLHIPNAHVLHTIVLS